jgi:hypothetical protein
MKGIGRHGPWIGGRSAGRPSETFREHVAFAPYCEEDHAALISIDAVLVGSEWPHPESLNEPASYVPAPLLGLSDADVRGITRDNVSRLVGLSAI